MKMAKASERDLEMANDLAGMLESFQRGYFPLPKDNDDSDEPQESRFFDRDDGRHCVEAMEMILDTLRRGSLFRVTFGMLVLLDPKNEAIDHSCDYLEHHPKVRMHDELVEALRNICDGTNADERSARDPAWLVEQVHLRARAVLAKLPEGR